MNTIWSIDELQKLWRLATELHQKQTYGGAQEGQHWAYISHIGSVTFEVLQALQQTPHLDAHLCISCAILHDTIEDTSFEYQDVEEQFGSAVAQGVLALSKDPTIKNKTEQMQDSLNRILAQPPEVGTVKLADRISNLSAPPHYWTNAKKRLYRDESKIILKTLYSCNPYLASRLAEKIEHYKQFIEP